MNKCLLRVVGDEFDPIEFLFASNLSAYTIFARGERSANRLKVAESSGFGCEVGCGSLEEQIKQATAFLTQHENDLRRISATSTVESCYLDFAYDCRLDGSAVAIQRDYLPSELLRLCGELKIGICLTLTFPCRGLAEESEGKQVS